MNASRFEALVRKTSNGARITDAVLVVVFGYLAFAADTPEWTMIWAASSGFCLMTAIFGPVDMIFHLLRDRFLKSGVKAKAAVANDNAPVSRQQRRALERSKGKAQ